MLVLVGRDILVRNRVLFQGLRVHISVLLGRAECVRDDPSKESRRSTSANIQVDRGLRRGIAFLRKPRIYVTILVRCLRVDGRVHQNLQGWSQLRRRFARDIASEVASRRKSEDAHARRIAAPRHRLRNNGAGAFQPILVLSGPIMAFQHAPVLQDHSGDPQSGEPLRDRLPLAAVDAALVVIATGADHDDGSGLPVCRRVVPHEDGLVHSRV
mmetsp:Transcript_38281/g.123138  ORF Transcript_38281/g.123138 Transcript_38281/m.123138 type:complete len:213 (+) Transcript_38281:271-909(+)